MYRSGELYRQANVTFFATAAADGETLSGEYNHLKLVLTDERVEITVYNRGGTLFTTNDERVRRLHRVMCRLGEA